MVQSKQQLLFISAVAITGSLLYFYFDPSLSKLFPPCPFYTLTGWFCPGCGSQRALHDILHGNIREAAGHNLLFVVFLPFLLFAAAVASYNILGKRKISQPIFNSTLFALAVFAVVVIFWIGRNIPLEPFTYLAP